MNKPETRYEASLTEEGRYRLLVEAIRDYAIYMLTPQGVIASWNQGAERFHGYAVDEIIGHHFSRGNTTRDEFFLGGRRVPWWAAGLSIYGTQLSAITMTSSANHHHRGDLIDSPVMARVAEPDPPRSG